MKTNDKDILATRSELRQQPYGVPEGYFDSFKAESFRKPMPDHGKSPCLMSQLLHLSPC